MNSILFVVLLLIFYTIALLIINLFSNSKKYRCVLYAENGTSYTNIYYYVGEKDISTNSITNIKKKIVYAFSKNDKVKKSPLSFMDFDYCYKVKYIEITSNNPNPTFKIIPNTVDSIYEIYEENTVII